MIHMNNKNSGVLILTGIIAALAVVLLAYVILARGPQPVACTQDALICPDGSGVGRVPPECRFAPCPDCTCPDGYVQEGDVCNPACFYVTPKCLAPSIPCSPAAG